MEDKSICILSYYGRVGCDSDGLCNKNKLRHSNNCFYRYLTTWIKVIWENLKQGLIVDTHSSHLLLRAPLIWASHQDYQVRFKIYLTHFIETWMNLLIRCFSSTCKLSFVLLLLQFQWCLWAFRNKLLFKIWPHSSISFILVPIQQEKVTLFIQIFLTLLAMYFSIPCMFFIVGTLCSFYLTKVYYRKVQVNIIFTYKFFYL